jgi:hypothetical protein
MSIHLAFVILVILGFLFKVLEPDVPHANRIAWVLWFVASLLWGLQSGVIRG